MTTEIVRFESAAELRAVAEPFLMRNEAEHNMILGLIGRLEREPYDPEYDPDFYASTPYLAAAVTDGEVVGAGVMTPPFPLVVSRWEGDREGLRLLARDLRAFDPEATGVNASVPVAASFAEAWSEITGEAVEQRLSERIYRLDTVRRPSGVEGEARLVTEADSELVTDWRMAFTREAVPREEGSRDTTRRIVNRILNMPPEIAGSFLWQRGDRPVCLVGYSSPTPNSLRIAPVYTPPEFRRRGFASACTAAVCQHILAGGKRFVTLFADLDNPTSNHVYQEIGFKPVCDVEVYYFDGR